MSKKRLRGSLDLLGGLDDILGVVMRYSPARDAEDDLFDSPFSPYSAVGDGVSHCASPAQKRVCVSPSVANPASPLSPPASSSTNTGESLGGDEMDLLRRKDEEMADMALFLARAVGEASSSSATLLELVSFLEQTGTARVLLALKRGESTEAFVHALAIARPPPAHRVFLLCLLMECMHHVVLDTYFQPSVIAFLVESLVLSDTHETVAASPSPVRAAAHWSARPKRGACPATLPIEASPSQPPRVDSRADALRLRVEALCPSAHVVRGAGSRRGAALALQVLLRLVFEYNRSLLLMTPSAFSVPLAVARAGGLEHLCALLGDVDIRAASLSLLEVLTASDALRREGARLREMVPVLLDLLRIPTLPAATQASVLKVLTDITNLIPTALADTNTVGSFVAYMKSVLSVPSSGDAEVDERETFVLCCAINVVLHEARDGTAPVVPVAPATTRAVVADDALLSTLAAGMAACYQRSESEQLVHSGYAALLLAALSLVVVDEDGATPRVPVITAVAAASRGTRIGQSTDRQPMRMVAAIIQEFLLFQSAAGTLTREALVAMDALVGRLRHQNEIPLTTTAGGESGEGEAESDGDDVTLAELL